MAEKVDMWKANDGTVHATEAEALQHESLKNLVSAELKARKVLFNYIDKTHSDAADIIETLSNVSDEAESAYQALGVIREAKRKAHQILLESYGK